MVMKAMPEKAKVKAMAMRMKFCRLRISRNTNTPHRVATMPGPENRIGKLTANPSLGTMRESQLLGWRDGDGNGRGDGDGELEMAA